MRCSTMLIAAAALTLTTNSRAEGPPRKGTYLRASLGPGMEVGPYRYSGRIVTNNFAAGHWGYAQSTEQNDIAGPGFRADFAIGGAVARNLVLAGEASVGMYYQERKSFGWISVAYTVNLSSGVLLDAWLFPNLPLHTFVASGIEIVGFAGGTDTMERERGYPEARDAKGPYAAVGAGWDLVRGKSGSFGVAVRVQMARVSRGDATYIPFNAALLATICTF